MVDVVQTGFSLIWQAIFEELGRCPQPLGPIFAAPKHRFVFLYVARTTFHETLHEGKSGVKFYSEKTELSGRVLCPPERFHDISRRRFSQILVPFRSSRLPGPFPPPDLVRWRIRERPA